jgi:hypothetical protein
VGTAYNFGLVVKANAVWNEKKKEAEERYGFVVYDHPLKSYNGTWRQVNKFKCATDPWLNKVSCKFVGVDRSLPLSLTDKLGLKVAWGISASYPRLKVPTEKQKEIRAAVQLSVLQKTITIKKPISGATVPAGSALLVEITNPSATTVNLHIHPKGNTWAAHIFKTTGTSLTVPGTIFSSTGLWTVRAQVEGAGSNSGPTKRLHHRQSLKSSHP